MRLTVTLILAVSMLMQSLPGLVMRRCVAMPDARTVAAAGIPTDAMCGCCELGKGGTIECPLAKSGYVGCNCKNPLPDDPRTPPSDHQKSQRVEGLFSALTPVVAFLQPEPTPAPVRWTAIDPPRHSGSHSIQSLLCVWVM